MPLPPKRAWAPLKLCGLRFGMEDARGRLGILLLP